MRKEVLLAIIFGVILGGIILYGINLANKSVSEISATPTPAIGNQISPTPDTANQTLQILSPSDNSVLFDAATTIKGIAKPGSHIAISTESDDFLTDTDSSGNFSTDIKLISGENNIKVVAVDSNEATSSAEITIIYTTTKL